MNHYGVLRCMITAGDSTRRKKQVGEAVRAQRVALELSQEALAEKVDCHRNYVGRVERGEQNLTIQMLWRFADALGCDAAVLLKVSAP